MRCSTNNNSSFLDETNSINEELHIIADSYISFRSDNVQLHIILDDRYVDNFFIDWIIINSNQF